MQTHWIDETIFYHIYPLGFCGAPMANDFTSPPVPRLEKIYQWIDHMRGLQVNALYLGPVFESGTHGYDTADYWSVDRRLGTNQTLADLIQELHRRGIRVILDGVFNHVGRNFWAFRDVQQNVECSARRDWFYRLDFNARSPYGDPFCYEGWNGNYDLVKLNLRAPEVKAHLFQAIQHWMQTFEIDGLRVDAADQIDPQFLHELSAFCHALRPDFWLVGEVIHGDYNHWANPRMLDSVTNYECYKGLYSSFVDKNFFEIAYSLNREFGPQGLYRSLPLYAFADNHDVNRVASQLTQPAHLYPLYCLLFTMPGVPSIYYGSEFGLTGKRTPQEDSALRPCLDLNALQQSCPQPQLPATLARLAALRQNLPALQLGDYEQVWVNHEQLIFARTIAGQTVYVAINASETPIEVQFDLLKPAASLQDTLNDGERFSVQNNRCRLTLPPYWARVLL